MMTRNFIRMLCVNISHMAQVPTTKRVQEKKTTHNYLFAVHLSMLGGFVGLVGYLGMTCHHMLH